MIRSSLMVSVLAAALALHPGAARAQVETREGIYLQNQILELRQQLQQLGQLQGQTAPPAQDNQPPPPTPEGGAPGGAAGAGAAETVPQLLVRVGELEEQLRTLQGRVNELTNQQQKDHDELSKKIDDLAFKLTNGASGAAPSSAPGGGSPDLGSGPSIGPDPQTPNAAPPAAPPPRLKRTADAALKAGNAALARRDYAAATVAANEVLAGPASPKSWDARYLLARAQLGQHDYKEAAANFARIYKAFPKSARGGEALLGATDALIALGKLAAACNFAAQVATEFPHDAVLRSRAAADRKRAKCA